MERIEIIRNGKDLLKIGAKQFMDYINSFVDEKAYISLNKKMTLKQENEWLRNSAKEINAKRKIKIILFIDEKIAGICDIRKGKIAEQYNVDFGLSIIKKYRGHGYGEMLLRKGIEIAKKRFNPHKIWISYQGENKIAKKLYTKIGFVKVARLKEYVNHFGKWMDKIIMEYQNK